MVYSTRLTINLMTTPVRVAANALESTSASFLVSASPLKSKSRLPAFQPFTISPFKQSRYHDLLNQTPTTAQEQELHNALIESERRDNNRKHAMISMQAGVVLQDLYVSQAREQLEEHEERRRKKNQTGYLAMDSQNCLTTMCSLTK